MGSLAFSSLPYILPIFALFLSNVLSLQDGRPSLVYHEPAVILRYGVRHARRQATEGQCPRANFTPCGQGLPANFCCSSTSTCLSLAANTTMLCCPAGRSCDTIQPTTCNIQRMNVTQDPVSPILTLALTSRLPRCGKGCCPFGYECINSNCVVSADQTSFSTGATPSKPADPATTTTLVPSTSPTEPSTNSVSAASNRSGVIAGSAIGSLFFVVVVSALGWSQRRRISEASSRYKRPRFSWPRIKFLRRRAPPTPPPKSPSFVFARESRSEWKSLHPPLKTVTPPPMELPATPLSFSFWHARRQARIARPRPIFAPPPNRGSAGFPEFI